MLRLVNKQAYEIRIGTVMKVTQRMLKNNGVRGGYFLVRVTDQEKPLWKDSI